MLRRLAHWTLAIVLFNIFLTLDSQAQQPKESKIKLRVLADPWCPHTCDPGERPGYMIEALNEIFQKSKFEIVYEATNWSRAIQETREGKAEAVAGALKADAPDFRFPLQPFDEQKSCWFASKSRTWTFTSSSKLEPFRTVGVVQDYTYGEPMDSKLKTLKIDPVSGVNTLERLFGKLLLGRTDLVVEDRAAAMDWLQRPDQQSTRKQVEEVECQKAVPLYIAFTPERTNKNVDLAIRHFNKNVSKFMMSAQSLALKKKYNLTQ